jgi:formimidoylglutamate deiminase
MEGFILDFYCDELKLGLEVDGEIHLGKEQAEYDQLRTEYLSEFGISITRVSNERVLNDLKKVLVEILNVAENRRKGVASSPSPPLRSEATPLPRERGGSAGEADRGEGVKFFKFTALLQHNGWLSPAYVGVDSSGLITYLSDRAPANAGAFDHVNGVALPGFQNSHSHAFQYAMAGLAENHPVGTHDDFWTWREAMYRCALSMDPDQAEAVAAMLYSEMLRHGYTHVAEFHYLHHDKSGKSYSNLAEMGGRMVSAARLAGIKITLIPVFYQKGNFGKEPELRQRRFISKSVDDYFKLLNASKDMVYRNEHSRLAFSVHSLRAVDLENVITTFSQAPIHLPFHLHVAEQKKEVNDCIAYCKKRPMQWLLDHLEVNDRFHLVHSTHLDDMELKRLAASGAHVILCPSTEGNLGDGIFRMKEYVKMGGRWSIGTDSHVGLNPLEEFRMIDYRQRLVTHTRNTFDGDAALYLVNEEVGSGRIAMGISSTNNFEPGQPFDAVIYDGSHPLLSTTSLKNLLPAIVYSCDVSANYGTVVNGKWIIRNNRHNQLTPIRTRFQKAIHQLANR